MKCSAIADRRRTVGGVCYLGGVGCRGPAAVRAAQHAAPVVQTLRDAFAKLESDKEFIAELQQVGGDDAELLLAKDAACCASSC